MGQAAIVLLALAGLAYYWFFVRNKKQVQSNDNTQHDDEGFIMKMKKSKRRMVVFYGSQTGTAEEFARRISKDGFRYGLPGIVADPDENNMQDLTKLKEVEGHLEKKCLVVFCLATYGEGDATDNAKTFFNWLQSSRDDLSCVSYTIFGLGNKTYENFNAMSRYVDKRLEKLGAVRIHPLGLGDDDGNLEDDFITWEEHFWKSVCSEFNLEENVEDCCIRQYKETILTENEYDPDRVFDGEPYRLHSLKTQRPPFDVKNPYMAPIKVNRNLHSSTSDRYCMHIELDIKDSRIVYKTGDHIAIYAPNEQFLVNRIGELLNIDLDVVFTMRAIDEDSNRRTPFPCPTTYRTALTNYIDITTPPRTHVLKEFAKYTQDKEEKSILVKMTETSEEGKKMYSNWIVESCRNIVHVLEDLPNCKPPLNHIMELLPRLQPRFYSISSSNKVHKETIHITAVVVEYQTKTGRVNNGVCTKWLQKMVPKTLESIATKEEKSKEFKVPCYVRRSNFRLPHKPQIPIIMVGPGTGIAPFRGFVQERAWQREQGKTVGETHLYFGCRSRNMDYIYQKELEKYERDGVIALHTAFSRDQPYKIYVTHRIKENALDIWRLIDKEGCHLYICGEAKNMAKDVRQIILTIIQENGMKTLEKAEEYLKEMEREKRYSTDIWS